MVKNMCGAALKSRKPEQYTGVKNDIEVNCMAIIDEISALYDNYLKTIEAVEKKDSNVQGLFRNMMGSGASSDSCNENFVTALREVIESFAASSPTSSETLDVVLAVHERSRSGEVSRTAGMMLEAVVGLLFPLVPYLDGRAAKEVLDKYYDKKTVRQLLPNQAKLHKALKARSF